MISLVRKIHDSVLVDNERALKISCSPVWQVRDTNVNVAWTHEQTQLLQLRTPVSLSHYSWTKLDRSTATTSEMLLQTSKGDQGRKRPSVILIASTQNWFQASVDRQLCYMSLLHHRSHCYPCSLEPQTNKQPSNSTPPVQRVLSKQCLAGGGGERGSIMMKISGKVFLLLSF